MLLTFKVDESRSLEVDPCIFKGFLRNDLEAVVSVTGGCPGSSSFDVSFLKIIVGMHPRGLLSKSEVLNFFLNFRFH